MAAKKKPLETVDAAGSDGNRAKWTDPVAQEKAASGTILRDVPPAEAAKQLVWWLKERKLI
jgi:hypothetical protein